MAKPTVSKRSVAIYNSPRRNDAGGAASTRASHLLEDEHLLRRRGHQVRSRHDRGPVRWPGSGSGFELLDRGGQPHAPASRSGSAMGPRRRFFVQGPRLLAVLRIGPDAPHLTMFDQSTGSRAKPRVRHLESTVDRASPGSMARSTPPALGWGHRSPAGTATPWLTRWSSRCARRRAIPRRTADRPRTLCSPFGAESSWKVSSRTMGTRSSNGLTRLPLRAPVQPVCPRQRAPLRREPDESTRTGRSDLRPDRPVHLQE